MDYLSILGLCSGCILIAIYVSHGWRKKESIHLVNAVVLFLASSGFIAGLKVAIFAFNPEVLPLLKKVGIDVPHIFLGGLAICWVSVLTAFQGFKAELRNTHDSQSTSTSMPETEKPSVIGPKGN